MHTSMGSDRCTNESEGHVKSLLLQAASVIVGVGPVDCGWCCSGELRPLQAEANTCGGGVCSKARQCCGSSRPPTAVASSCNSSTGASCLRGRRGVRTHLEFLHELLQVLPRFDLAPTLLHQLRVHLHTCIEWQLLQFQAGQCGVATPCMM